ncbi:group 1 glycosyl transferase [Pseudomonas sp. Os17]|nr:group 1 glycosyl transferase [Pseudomonas sp. Os17]
MLSVFKKYGKPDIIHAHACYPGGYIASILSKEFGIPYVLTEHMSPFPFSFLIEKGKINPKVNLAYKKAAKTIAVSSSLAKKINALDLSSPVVVPNLVNEDLFYPALYQSKKFIFFSLAVISHQKGIDHLLHAISLWAPDSQKFEFRIGGDGPLLNEYIQLAEKLGISDRVRWLGRTSRASAVKQFQESNVFILPSRHETFGVVYAEALACGKPVIATRCGGPEDIVNENNGMLVQVGNISELAGAMRYISEHIDEFNTQVIRDDFIQRFSRKAVVDKIFNIYEEIIQGE